MICKQCSRQMVETFNNENLKSYACMYYGHTMNIKPKKLKHKHNKLKPKYTVEELYKALDVRSYFNKMEFDEFYKIVYQYIDKEQMRKNHMTRKEWKFTGLINTDFVMMFCYEDSKDKRLSMMFCNRKGDKK